MNKRRLAVLLLAATPILPARAEAISGRFWGEITCGKLPNTAGQTRTGATLHVVAGDVAFQRNIVELTGNRSVSIEAGEGGISPAGEVALTTEWRGRRGEMTGRYTGRLTAEGGTLEGTSDWTIDGVTTPGRSCTVTLKRR